MSAFTYDLIPLGICVNGFTAGKVTNDVPYCIDQYVVCRRRLTKMSISGTTNELGVSALRFILWRRPRTWDPDILSSQ
jgi:hypothetical protein